MMDKIDVLIEIIKVTHGQTDYALRVIHEIAVRQLDEEEVSAQSLQEE